ICIFLNSFFFSTLCFFTSSSYSGFKKRTILFFSSSRPCCLYYWFGVVFSLFFIQGRFRFPLFYSNVPSRFVNHRKGGRTGIGAGLA
ncbi:hypothetical protein QBC42DRAFT_274511, partial [Cladorrhinum samala]